MLATFLRTFSGLQFEYTIKQIGQININFTGVICFNSFLENIFKSTFKLKKGNSSVSQERTKPKARQISLIKQNNILTLLQ